MKFCPLVILFLPYVLLTFVVLPFVCCFLTICRFTLCIKLYSLLCFCRLKRSGNPLHSQVFQFQHFGSFDRVEKHQNNICKHQKQKANRIWCLTHSFWENINFPVKLWLKELRIMKHCFSLCFSDGINNTNINVNQL